MKFYLDTEFHEYKKKPLFSKGINTIELISIGIVVEDNENTPNLSNDIYFISKDFDIKMAWNNQWLRDNVLMSIFFELAYAEFHSTHFKDEWIVNGELVRANNFHTIKYSQDRKEFKRLINKYGKSNEYIAKEIKEFVYNASGINNPDTIGNWDEVKHLFPIDFYAYFGDFDWVVFCWLFGRMIDLPEGFPKYCIDLKQELNTKLTGNMIKFGQSLASTELIELRALENLEERLNWIKKYSKDYPKQEDEHHSLADAKWNKSLHEFLKSI